MPQLERCSFLQYVTSTPRLPLGGVRKLGHGGVTVDKLSTTPDGEAIADPGVRRLHFVSNHPCSSFALNLHELPYGTDPCTQHYSLGTGIADVCNCACAGLVAGGSDMYTPIAPPCLCHERGALRASGSCDATCHRLWERLNAELLTALLKQARTHIHRTGCTHGPLLYAGFRTNILFDRQQHHLFHEPQIRRLLEGSSMVSS